MKIDNRLVMFIYEKVMLGIARAAFSLRVTVGLVRLGCNPSQSVRRRAGGGWQPGCPPPRSLRRGNSCTSRSLRLVTSISMAGDPSIPARGLPAGSAGAGQRMVVTSYERYGSR
jgi:hypothetical protein